VSEYKQGGNWKAIINEALNHVAMLEVHLMCMQTAS